jgi:Nif-specific regulatory protein
MASLRALAGPLQGVIFRLPEEEVRIGRQPSNQMCIGDPSVSRQHCLIQPRDGQFEIRDLGSNNGTFVNGTRIDECVLAEGDRIRIGDTVFQFASREASEAEQALDLRDNGLIAVTAVERKISGSDPTAIQKLLDTALQGGESPAQARALLRIGAALSAWQEPEGLQIELLKRILEWVPAEQGAVVLAARGDGAEPAITGWDQRSGEPAALPISRTLVTRAIRDSSATFSDDVTRYLEFGELSSLTARNVVSVIVVPLRTEQQTIGAIYLDSAHPLNRLTQEHLEFMVAVAECAASALERVSQLWMLKEENQRLQRAFQLDHNLIGCSPPMRHIVERIARIGRTDATVMIRGETGTGKELAARAIHQNSARAGRPFEAINCSLLRDTLLESELFGHERGAFTGAIAMKKGKLELADGGTLFLDELAELGDGPQAMLLRVLQTREFQRVGGVRTMRVDIRIMAATNKNLEEAVRDKTFREDLYYRLNVVSLNMPPLRERRQDIALLADHFVHIYSRKNKRQVRSVSSEATNLLMRYQWPGNVRELENAIEHAVVFGSTDEVLPEDLPEVLIPSPEAGSPPGYHAAVREAKRNIVRVAMEQAGGSFVEGARLLGIHVNNLHRLIRELDLKPALIASRGICGKRARADLV